MSFYVTSREIKAIPFHVPELLTICSGLCDTKPKNCNCLIRFNHRKYRKNITEATQYCYMIILFRQINQQ